MRQLRYRGSCGGRGQSSDLINMAESRLMRARPPVRTKAGLSPLVAALASVRQPQLQQKAAVTLFCHHTCGAVNVPVAPAAVQALPAKKKRICTPHPEENVPGTSRHTSEPRHPTHLTSGPRPAWSMLHTCACLNMRSQPDLQSLLTEIMLIN